MSTMLIDDMMQSEAAGIENILRNPTENIEDVYDDLDRNPELDVEEALGFAYLVKDNEDKDLMKALNELSKNGMTFPQIKKSING